MSAGTGLAPAESDTHIDHVLSNEALDDLDRKRQAATPGPWKHDNRTKQHLGLDPYVTTMAEEVVACFSMETPEDKGLANLDFIAAANPEAIGRIIAEVKAHRSAQGIQTVILGGESNTVDAWSARLNALKASTDFSRIALMPAPDETEGVLAAAEFFEAMDASGDREPLTPSAIACLLRERVWEHYRKASAEHSARVQDAIASRIVASEFRAIAEAHPDAIVQDGLRHVAYSQDYNALRFEEDAGGALPEHRPPTDAEMREAKHTVYSAVNEALKASGAPNSLQQNWGMQ